MHIYADTVQVVKKIYAYSDSRAHLKPSIAAIPSESISLLFFPPYCRACRILVTQPGTEPALLRWKHRFLSTRLPVKPPLSISLKDFPEKETRQLAGSAVWALTSREGLLPPSLS